MITKKELLEKLTELNSQGNALTLWLKLEAWAQSLPDYQPDLLPFEWPVKEGYEVVTGDERKVGQLHKFDVEADFPVVGILDGSIEAWTSDGRYSATGINVIQDLFLRRVEKKVWVVEYDNGTWYTCDEKPDPNPDAKIYEGTLKPVK